MVLRIASGFLPMLFCVLLLLLPSMPLPVTESITPPGDQAGAITGSEEMNPDSRAPIAIQVPGAAPLSKGTAGSSPTPATTKPPLPAYIPCLAVILGIIILGERLRRR